MFNIREFLSFWVNFHFIIWKDFVKLNDSYWSTREYNNIVRHSFISPPDREEKQLFSPVFMRLISHPQIQNGYFDIGGQFWKFLLSALQKCILSVDRTDNISSFDIMQMGLFYFNYAVSSPVEVIYSLKGMRM